MNPRTWIPALCGLLILSGCADYDTRLSAATPRYLGTDSIVIDPSVKESLAPQKSYWDGDGIVGAPSMVISPSEQTASFYKGDKLVGVSAISSGREGYGTPAGSYKIIQKVIDHKSNLYGDFVDALEHGRAEERGFQATRLPPERNSPVRRCRTSCA